jgi:alkanesulfonate monooxygenase SsuD/methylene tetrahydromethanopterin reductase-like flavin-dependent oxidoreductase (luciferase family)
MKSFGISILGHSLLKTVELCKIAEEAGFDTAWLPDESPSPPFRDVSVGMTMCLLNT